jgi:hypothetical protein
MRKKTRSILEELQNYRNYDPDFMIEGSATNILESVINLINRIDKQYGPETSMKVEKKFINAMKTGDIDKFTRSLKKMIKETKNDDPK